MRLHLALLLLALLTPTLTRAEAVTEPDVHTALRTDTTIRVLAILDVPTTDARTRPEHIATRADAALASLPRGHYHLRHRYTHVAALALELDATALDALARAPGVTRIGLDVGGHGAMAQAAPLAGVTNTLVAGLDGAGAKIAVLDSGIDTDHPDFTGRVAAQQCFCAGPAGAVGCCPNGLDTMSGAGSAEDDHGHGSNVTGIATGGGSVALRGAAPEATLVAVKVLDANNSFCCSSDVVAALDFVRTNHPDTDVINASLGTGALFTGVCDNSAAFTMAMAQAVNALVANGTMVFASTGNQRNATSTSAPACLANTFGVGAVWDSNVGSQTVLGCTENTAADLPTCFTNSNANVDLYAPGAPVTSTGRNGGTSTFFGTSQATPLTAGCATALRGALPSLTVAQIEAALEASPTTVIDPKNGLSFPRLDCAAAASLLGLDAIFEDGFE